MDLNLIEFIFFYIFIFILFQTGWKTESQQLFLLAVSYYFYINMSSYSILLLITTSLITYYCGYIINKYDNFKIKKLFLLISLAATLGVLISFKYINIFIYIINCILELVIINLHITQKDIPLPIGISFYSFRALSYVFDIYRGKLEPIRPFYKFALFVAFFPEMLAGPIDRAIQFIPNLKNKIIITPYNLKFGITLITWGMIKKIIIADNLAPYVDAIFSQPTDFASFYVIGATLLFAVQLYCDFSGYCDIAIGASRVIGYHIPQNFNKPFFSSSPVDFWRRWHITLSSYIRDYLYIPLGGNRKGKARTYINLMIAMLLCGLWHGSNWNFVIWGGYHGLLLIFHRILCVESRFERVAFPNSYFIQLIKIGITQYFILLGWLIFRVNSTPNLIYCIKKYIIFDFIFPCNQRIFCIGILILLFLILILSTNKKCTKILIEYINTDIITYVSSLQLRYWLLYLTFVMLTLMCFSPSSSPEFIYAQF